MGQMVRAVCHWQGRSETGTALLEGDHLLFRGPFRLKLMLADILSAVAGNGRLSLTTTTGTVALDLGDKAAAWADRIRHPRSLADKLGLIRGGEVWLTGAEPDPVLLAELDAKEITRHRGATPPAGIGLVLLTAAHVAELDAVESIAAGLGPKAALWIVFPKGKASAVPQEAVFAAGRGAGLVDTKTCAVSAVSTALRFVRRAAAD